MLFLELFHISLDKVGYFTITLLISRNLNQLNL